MGIDHGEKIMAKLVNITPIRVELVHWGSKPDTTGGHHLAIRKKCWGKVGRFSRQTTHWWFSPIMDTYLQLA